MGSTTIGGGLDGASFIRLENLTPTVSPGANSFEGVINLKVGPLDAMRTVCRQQKINALILFMAFWVRVIA
jgi:hypothetical protein